MTPTTPTPSRWRPPSGAWLPCRRSAARPSWGSWPSWATSGRRSTPAWPRWPTSSGSGSSPWPPPTTAASRWPTGRRRSNGWAPSVPVMPSWSRGAGRPVLRASPVRSPPREDRGLMKIYTRKGDDGTTGLLFGGRVRKDAPAPAACGDVDEAQAALGVARATTEPGSELDGLLIGLERDLWVLMAEVATAPEHRDRLVAAKTLVTAEMVTALEPLID